MRIARFALLFVACTGTDTGNPPVIGFKGSACHDQSYVGDKGVILQSVDQAPLVPDARYKGATCVMSERRADALHLYVSNFAAACTTGVDWKPRVEERSDGGLDVILEDDDCQVARCGTCLYDFDFELPLSFASASEVHVSQRGCGDDPDEIIAPLREGVACNYTPVNALVFRARGDTGERMLCGDGAYGEWGPCDASLTCTPVDPAQQYGRCLRSCTSNSDCDSLSACVDNVCKLSATGLVTP